MADKKALTDEELDKVVGGTLSKEAEDWIERNKEEIYKRAGEENRTALDNALAGGRNWICEISLDTVKAIIGGYIDISDLI